MQSFKAFFLILNLFVIKRYLNKQKKKL